MKKKLTRTLLTPIWLKRSFYCRGRLIAAILVMAMAFSLFPSAARATDYYNSRITDMQYSDTSKTSITSITVQFRTSSTYASYWFLAINDETNFVPNSNNYDGNERFFIPCDPRNQANGITGMTDAGMPALACGSEAGASDGDHTMTLVPADPITRNDNYKLRLWIYIPATWSGYSHGYYYDQTWDLAGMIDIYENNYTTMLSPGTGSSRSNGSEMQSVPKGTAIGGYTFTASNDHYFPESYAWSSDGLTATRISDSEVRVSGTPTANITATLPAATAKTPLTSVALTPDTAPLEPGTQLTAGSLAPAGASATYAWSRNTDSNAYPWEWELLAGGAAYTTTVADIGYYIRVVATGSGLYYGETSATTTNPVAWGANASVAPTVADYDKYTATAGVTFTLNPGVSFSLQAVKNGNVTLTPGTDYTVSNNVCTIAQSYLNAQSVGKVTLTFDMSDGIDPTAVINVTDNEPAPPPSITITPGATFPQGSAPGNLRVTVDAGTGINLENLVSATMDGATLTNGNEYIGSTGSIVMAFKQSYLNTLAPGRHTLRVTLTGGAQVEATITVTAPVPIPATGDGSTPLMWAGLILLAGCALLVLRRKRRARG